MTVSELISKLQEFDPEAEVITTKFNGQVRTYALVDFVLQLDCEGVYSDLFGTPGPTDDRLLKLTSKHLVSIDTLFQRNERYRPVSYEQLKNLISNKGFFANLSTDDDRWGGNIPSEEYLAMLRKGETEKEIPF